MAKKKTKKTNAKQVDAKKVEKKVETKKVVEEVFEKPASRVEKEGKHNTKDILKKVFDILFWLVIILLTVIWIVDFVKVQNDDKPMFCIKKEVHNFEDGTVDECLGLGYKVYNYNRESVDTKVGFVPFFAKMDK